MSKMTKNKIYYRRNLPHYQPSNSTFFVTYRLGGSLPIETIKRLKEEREREIINISCYDNKKVRYEKYKQYQKIYFGKFDELLDGSAYGPQWLKNDKVAEIVKEAIHHHDKIDYELICFTIMPNHVHQVFTPIETNNVARDLSRAPTKQDSSERNNNSFDINVDLQLPVVTNILRLIKGSTARECNKILCRSGTFWQHESYDHVVRNERELKRIIKYVLNNPVKAGLCKNWEDWKWSYCNFHLLV